MVNISGTGALAFRIDKATRDNCGSHIAPTDRIVNAHLFADAVWAAGHEGETDP
jgi:hypothetical protein